MKNGVRAILLLMALTVLGCNDNNVATGSQLAALRQQLDQQNKTLEQLKNDVADIKRARDWDDTVRDWDQIAYLTPGSRNYNTIKFDMGILTVSLQDVRAYANGSQIVLTFGNPTSATLTDVKAKIEWGSVDAKGSPMNEEAKTKEVQFEKPFQAGSWTNVQVILEGTPPTALGFVRVRELSNKGITLRKW